MDEVTALFPPSVPLHRFAFLSNTWECELFYEEGGSKSEIIALSKDPLYHGLFKGYHEALFDAPPLNATVVAMINPRDSAISIMRMYPKPFPFAEPLS